MADEPRYPDEIRIPITIKLPWSARMTREGKPWARDARGRDWPEYRGRPTFPIDQLPHGFAPGTIAIYQPGDGRRVTDWFAAMDDAMRAEGGRAETAVRLIADRKPGRNAGENGNPETSMLDQDAFDRGIASSPHDGAIRIPDDHDSHLRATPLLDSFGMAIHGASGSIAQTPEAFSAAFFFQRGREDASLYADAVAKWRSSKAVESMSDNGQSMADAAAAGFAFDRFLLDISLRNTPLRRFGQQGLWDVQRHHSKAIMPEFREAASIYIGIYAAAAGIPRDMIQEIQDDYASLNSQFSNQKMDGTYRALPEVNVGNVNIGYNLVLDKRI